MMIEEAEQLLAKVSATVLTAIKTMSNKQQTKKPICLDSISLVLRIKLSELEPVIRYLESTGEIIIHPNTSKTSRASKPDSISLNN